LIPYDKVSVDSMCCWCSSSLQTQCKWQPACLCHTHLPPRCWAGRQLGNNCRSDSSTPHTTTRQALSFTGTHNRTLDATHPTCLPLQPLTHTCRRHCTAHLHLHHTSSGSGAVLLSVGLSCSPKAWSWQKQRAAELSSADSTQDTRDTVFLLQVCGGSVREGVGSLCAAFRGSK
jgi:hypothetical protein